MLAATAVTIFSTALHAIRLLFFRKEILLAIGFGLIDGLAFSMVLSDMQPDGIQMVYSIMGFNIGI